MATESELLAAVLAHPDEDTPRLVYADWLDDHADPTGRDRAAFIRHQIDRANDPDAVPSPDEGADHDRLHRLAFAAWLPPLPAWATNPQFGRGFVEHVTCSPDDFIRGADELFAAAPVRRVRFESPAPPPPGLARCPHLRRIRAFELGVPLSPEDVRTLFGSPHLGDVLELSGFRGNVATDGGLKALADCPALASLRTLYLGGPVTADGLAALANNPHVRGLRSLTIAGAGVRDAGARKLAAWPGLRGVTTLRLHDCKIGPAGVEALTASAHLGPLARLSLSGNRIEAGGAAALGRCARLRSVRELVLDGPLGESESQALFGGGVFAGLRSLHLGSHYLFGDPVWEAALAAAPLGDLHTLRLTQGRTRSEALTALAAAPWVRTLQHLDLSGNKCDTHSMAVLAAAPLDGIRVLDLSENCLDDDGAAALAGAPWLRGVRRLDLTFNAIGDDGAAALANSPHLPRLDHFRIDHNPLGPAGVRALLDSPAVPPDATIFPEWGWFEDDERATVRAELAKYGDRVTLPEP